MTKAAIYLRTASTEGHNVNLPDQRASAEAFAAARGWSIVATFCDAGFSANRIARPGLNAMLAAARSGAFDVLVVEDLHRLARQPEMLAVMLRTICNAGVEVVVTSGSIHGPDVASVDWAALACGSARQARTPGSNRSQAPCTARRTRT
ncbi:MAG: recombinase family protein [Maritimibacter sp.]|nr:recombinase family protein [Maritimibacter sp.]